MGRGWHWLLQFCVRVVRWARAGAQVEGRARAGTRRQQTHPPMQTSSTRPAARDARPTNCLEHQTLNAAKIYENGV